MIKLGVNGKKAKGVLLLVLVLDTTHARIGKTSNHGLTAVKIGPHPLMSSATAFF
jgi:hypothetical protein